MEGSRVKVKNPKNLKCKGDFGRSKLYKMIALCLIGLSIALSCTVFYPSTLRGWQSIVDLVNSIGYLFSDNVTPTVSKVPENMDTVLPLTVQEFKELMQRFGKLLIDGNNVLDFFITVLIITLSLALIAVWLFVIGKLAWLVIKDRYNVVDNKHGTMSKQLKGWLKIEDIFWYKPKEFVKDFLFYVWLLQKALIVIFAIVWAWNLNLITIAFELVAFIIYTLKAWDALNLFVQVAKLFVDISVVLFTIPFPVWCWGAYKIFHHKRSEKGIEELEREEDVTTNFLENNPGDILATGKRRVGKTKLITYFQKVQERIYRRTAKKKSLDIRMEFPFFPWTVLEQSIINIRQKVKTFSMRFMRSWLNRMRGLFESRNVLTKNGAEEELDGLHSIGYIGADFSFGYDYKRFGLEYDNNVQTVKLFNSIVRYAEQFYIYSSPKIDIFSNFPISAYLRWEDYGNYPLLDEYNNVYRATTAELEKYSQFSKKYYFDMGRLGEQKNPNGAYNFNFEYGVIGISEAGKEYGNQNTNRGFKTEDKGCTPNNDLAPLNAKMEGQGRTYDNQDYYRRFMDEQRPSSMQADVLETLTEMRVLRRLKAEIRLPHFKLEEKIYHFAREKMNKFLDYILPLHGQDLLITYFAYKVFSIIQNHYIRIYNQFASEEMHVKMIDRSNGEELGEAGTEVVYVPMREIVGAYKTNYFATIYIERAKRSKTGGNLQVPQYSSIETSISDMREIGSHFYDKILDRTEVTEVANDDWDQDLDFAVFKNIKVVEKKKNEENHQNLVRHIQSNMADGERA